MIRILSRGSAWLSACCSNDVVVIYIIKVSDDREVKNVLLSVVVTNNLLVLFQWLRIVASGLKNENYTIISKLPGNWEKEGIR